MRRRRALAAAAGLLTLVLVAVAALLILSARGKLLDGLAEVHRAERAVRPAAVRRSVDVALTGSRGHVARARDDFHAASERLSPLAPLLEHLGWVPAIGHRVAAAPAAADAADMAAEGALQLLGGLQPAARTLGRGGAAGHASPEAVRALAGSREAFDTSCSLFHRAEERRRGIGTPGDATLASALASFDRQVPRLAGLCRALALLPQILGYPHPRTYLLAYQDPMELRATGGFIGSASLVTLRAGAASQEFHGAGFAHDDTSYPSPEPMRLYSQEPYWLFSDSNWSPDFPVSAQLERFFLRLDEQRDVDGVIDLTPRAVAGLLGATGPIYSPEYKRWITSGNVGRLADYYAHWAPVPGPRRLVNRNARRKQFIGIVAPRLLQRVRNLPAARLLDLSGALSDAVGSRDVLIYFRDPAEQALSHLIGASGEIAPAMSDYLYVVDSNLSFNKINPYVHLWVTYRVRIRRDRWLQAHLALRFTNRPAPPREANYGLGPGAGALGGPDDYGDFVRIYVPAGAQLARQSGWTQPWSPGLAYGKTMLCGYLIVRAGQTRTVSLDYIVPPNIFEPTSGRRYQLVVQHQPGSHPDRVSVSVALDEGGFRDRAINKPQRDWKISIPVIRAPYHPVPLPVARRPVVAPGYWIEPHAFLAPMKP